MSKPLKPFFSYFGSKYRVSKKYPVPTKEVLIEPFAGSACYSLHYPHKQVKLFDKYEVICSIWDYLIHVKESEILALPILKDDDHIDAFNIPQEARNLIGFWLATGHTSPSKKLSGFSRIHSKAGKLMYKDGYARHTMPHKSWSEAQKNIIASQVNYIRHWRISHTSYENIPNEDATWFIDPPYQKAGKNYKESSKNIDFNHLSEWCRERQGEVIVCENLGADWLPFKEFQNLRSTIGKATTEAMYTQGINEIQLSLFGDEQK